MPKLIQIAIEQAAGTQTAILWGLCKDGSLWMRNLSGSGEWLRVASPPRPAKNGKLSTSGKVTVPDLMELPDRVTGSAAAG